MGQPALGRFAFLAEHLLCLNQLIGLSTLPTPNLAFRRTLIFMYKLKIAQKADSSLPAPQAIFFLGPSAGPGWHLVNAALCAGLAAPPDPHSALGPHWPPGPAVGLHRGPRPEEGIKAASAHLSCHSGRCSQEVTTKSDRDHNVRGETLLFFGRGQGTQRVGWSAGWWFKSTLRTTAAFLKCCSGFYYCVGDATASTRGG